jgi:hypothetical protein
MSTELPDNNTSIPIQPPGRDEDASSEPTPAADPVNRWATEHYGFADEAAVPTPTPAPSGVAATTSSRHPKALLTGAVMALLVISGVGGAAVAADGDGPGDGPNGIVQFDGRDGFDGYGDGDGDGNEGGGR